MKCCTMLILVIAVTFGYTQAPDTMWTRTFGEVDDDDYGNCVQQLSDGSYIITGCINDSICLMKTDADGNCLWIKKYNPTDIVALCGGTYVQQTTDGGYIIAGNWQTMPVGPFGVLIKTDMNGDPLWIHTEGLGPLSCVKETADTCYIAVGGNWAGQLVKFDNQGDVVWSKGYGGYPNVGAFNSVQQLNDGGYVIVGRTNIFGAGDVDVWFAKADASGDTIWTRTYGGSGWDAGYSFQPTSNNGYMITGSTHSFGAGESDLYLIKINGSGDTLWTKTLGGQYRDEGNSIEIAHDSGYVITGRTDSYGAGGYDLWFLKIRPNGDTLWTMTLGGAEDDCGNNVCRTSEGGYIIAGATWSFGPGEEDAWFIKTGPDVGIYEQETSIATTEFIKSTIFRGPLQLPTDRKCKVFDITGRNIALDNMKPGIYFIEVDDVIIQKVVKVR